MCANHPELGGLRYKNGKKCVTCKRQNTLASSRRARAQKDRPYNPWRLCPVHPELDGLRTITGICVECLRIANHEKKIRQHFKTPEAIAAYYERKAARERKRAECDDHTYRKIERILRSSILNAITGRTNGRRFHTHSLLGCSVAFARKYLEAQFQPGMRWTNHGQFGWHIDHRIPLTAFNLNDPIDQMRACHWSNLQPLWWQDNVVKGGRLPPLDDDPLSHLFWPDPHRLQNNHSPNLSQEENSDP